MSESKDYFVWAKLDDDDETMNTPEIREKIEKEYPEVTVKWGLSTGKIHAINRDCGEDLPACDILIIMSDDIVWDVFGFDNDIREAFQKHFPNLDGTVHFPDDHGQERTIIVSIVGINLYNSLGYLYHQSFISVYADDHFTELTKKIGKYVFIDKRLFTHAHPIWMLTEWDDQYRHSERPEVYQKDRDTFLELKANNFGI